MVSQPVAFWYFHLWPCAMLLIKLNKTVTREERIRRLGCCGWIKKRNWKRIIDLLQEVDILKLIYKLDSKLRWCPISLHMSWPFASVPHRWSHSSIDYALNIGWIFFKVYFTFLLPWLIMQSTLVKWVKIAPFKSIDTSLNWRFRSIDHVNELSHKDLKLPIDCCHLLFHG